MELTKEYLDKKFAESEVKLDKKLAGLETSLENRLSKKIDESTETLARIIETTVARPMEKHFTEIKKIKDALHLS